MPEIDEFPRHNSLDKLIKCSEIHFTYCVRRRFVVSGYAIGMTTSAKIKLILSHSIIDGFAAIRRQPRYLKSYLSEKKERHRFPVQECRDLVL